MQTIDLGNITIGGDAPQQPPMAPELPCLDCLLYTSPSPRDA